MTEPILLVSELSDGPLKTNGSSTGNQTSASRIVRKREWEPGAVQRTNAGSSSHVCGNSAGIGKWECSAWAAHTNSAR